MKILLLTPFLPYRRAMAGAPRAVYHRLRLLAGEHRVTVVTFVEPGEEKELAGLRAFGLQVYAVPRKPVLPGNRPALWRKRLGLAMGLLTDSRPMLVQEFGSRRMCRVVERLARKEQFDVI